MPTVYVYNYNRNAVERYVLGDNDTMPYAFGRTMTVREFRARSCSPVLWIDLRAILAWNELRLAYGRSIPIGAAFKRIWEGGHAGQSQHYAGVSFDIGQGLSQAERNTIHGIATRSGIWGYVEPLYLTPTWVHVDRRIGTPACAAGGYPLIRQGDRGVYVFVAQDALAALGYPGGGLDGVFGPGMRTAAMNFQRAYGLSADGVIGCGTWNALTRYALGRGQTATVIGKC